jgi:hypothetical protein
MTVCILLTFTEVIILKFTGSPVSALVLSTTTCGKAKEPASDVFSGGKEMMGVGSGVGEGVAVGASVGATVGESVTTAEGETSACVGDSVSSDLTPSEHADKDANMHTVVKTTATYLRHLRRDAGDGFLGITSSFNKIIAIS